MKLLFPLLLAWGLFAQAFSGLYIVQLEDEPAVTRRAAGRAAMAQQQAAVRASQARVRRALSEPVTVLDSVETVASALIVRALEGDVPRIAAIAGVRRVLPVLEVKLELDRAAAIHKVTDAWREIGGEDKAGQGVKIGILDSGIDVSHPGFSDPSLTVPEGYPKLGEESFHPYASRKVIVAKSYERLAGVTTPPSPEDRSGHGTGVAMAAAGARAESPFGPVSGMAPKAFLGNYKVFGGPAGNVSSTAAMLKGIDEAVADGMDIINMSSGSVPAARPQYDILSEAVDRAGAAGVILVKSAGNDGPDPASLSAPTAASTAIVVGATWTDRLFASAVKIEGAPPILALPGDGPEPAGGSVAGPLKDVALIDGNGLACDRFPAGSLSGTIAFILRGDCFFEVKINNAQAAGAVAALLYTDAERPDAIYMATGTATLPALMVSHANGVALKNRIKENPELAATLVFGREPFPVNPERLVEFSSRGPSTDEGIKPDLTAVGVEILTATQKDFPQGDMHSPGGFILVDGTSFSAPLVAGAAAVVKAARPQLTAEQLRSVIVNSSSPLVSGENPAPVQQAGAGKLNVLAALRNPAAISPTSVSFGTGGGTIGNARQISVTNLGPEADTFAVTVAPLDAALTPVAAPNALELAPGETKSFAFRLQGDSPAPGEYQGFLIVKGTRAEAESRIPYWYGVPANKPEILALRGPSAPSALGATVTLYIRVTDKAGIPAVEQEPRVTAVSQGASVTSVESLHNSVPGVFMARLRLASAPAGANQVFRVQVGELSRDYTVTVR